MMFVTCFKKEPPRTSGPVIEIISNEDDAKSIKLTDEKSNGHANGNNLRALPVINSSSSVVRSIKSVKTFLCCGCCAHPSVSPSQEVMLEIRSPGIARHSAAVHSIRSKFTELREDSLEETVSQVEDTVKSKPPHTHCDQKSNSISEKSSSSKHFEKIYSISEKVDDVYKTSCSSSIKNAQFFTRNALSTQEAPRNANSEDTCSNGSRHSHFSRKSPRSIENNYSNKSTLILRAPDLPEIHRLGTRKNVNPVNVHESAPTANSIHTTGNVNELIKKRSPGDLNLIDSFETIIKNPSNNMKLISPATIHEVKESSRSSSAGKNISQCNDYQELMEKKPKTALTKESEEYPSHLFIEDKISVKENTWFGNSVHHSDESDGESIDGNRSERSISSNHLSFGRSLSIESNESLRQVVNLESNISGRETRDTSGNSQITVIDKTKENSVANDKIDDVIDFSDENNNEKMVEGTKQTFDEISGCSENIEKLDLGMAHQFDEQVLNNEPVPLLQFPSANLKKIQDELSCRSFSDRNDDEVEHENKSQNIRPKMAEKINEQTLPEEVGPIKKENINYFYLNQNENGKREFSKTQFNDLSRENNAKYCHYNESDDFGEKVSNVQVEPVEYANEIENQLYSKHDESLPIKEAVSYSDCEEEYTHYNMNEVLDSGSENVEHLRSLYDQYGQDLGHNMLKRRSFQYESILQDVSHNTSDLDNRYDLVFFFFLIFLPTRIL